MSTEHKKTLEKAKQTQYKHRIWSLEHMGIDTVYGFMEWAAGYGGMFLDLKPSIKYLSDIPELEKTNLLKDGYNKREILELCIQQGLYKYIILRSDERGSDSGILKIKTYLILKGLI